MWTLILIFTATSYASSGGRSITTTTVTAIDTLSDCQKIGEQAKRAVSDTDGTVIARYMCFLK